MANFGGHYYHKVNESWEGRNFTYIQFVYTIVVKISQQVQLMIIVVIENLIYVVMNAYCSYCIEPKKEGERNESVKSVF
jgi:hypothetical protein